jgi:hypothetical protein
MRKRRSDGDGPFAGTADSSATYARGVAFAAAYSASVTASWNSVRPMVVVVCDISVLEVAPCQCRSLGAIHTVSPARTRCGASPSLQTNP